MFGHNGAKGGSARPSRSDAAARPEPVPAAPVTLLTIVGQQSRAEGKFEAAVSIDSLVISQGGFFNGNVAKIREHDVHSGPRPVKRLGAQK